MFSTNRTAILNIFAISAVLATLMLDSKTLERAVPKRLTPFLEAFPSRPDCSTIEFAVIWFRAKTALSNWTSVLSLVSSNFSAVDFGTPGYSAEPRTVS